MSFTIGSLFDGSGGFPLAGFMCGGAPVWASEIEPYPISVTKTRFPHMKHLGSITDIKGNEIDPVDIITFGSPCQDLSVAGKRAGLKHEDNGDDETTRSGLFMEAVRIIKEMREATNGAYPRFALWENVPGAFSSNKGEDFRIVLEELVKVAEPTAVMPGVPEAGWAYSDVYCGDGWSLAYRVFDAQHWGVPQRRRRIYLVADFRGKRAGKVLFEREGLRGDFAQGGTAWQETAGYAENGIGADDRAGEISDVIPINTMIATRHKQLGRGTGFGLAEMGDPQFTISAGHEHAVAYTLKIRSGCEGGGKGALIQTDMSATLATNNDQYLFQPVTYDARGNGDGDTASTITGDHENRITDYTSVVVEPMLASGRDVTGRLMASGYEKLGAQEMFSGDYTVIEKHPIPIHDQATRFSGKRGDKSDGKGNGLGVGAPGDPMNTLTSGDRHAVAYAMQGFGDYKESGVASGLKARDYKDATDLVAEIPVAIDRAYFNQGQNALYDPQLYEDGTNPTLVARGPNAVAVRYIVRRLTPTECARLQGFPDKWGHPDVKDDFTEEEFRFWLDVRNTHAAINGKAVKEYTKEQMLKWYNNLHTDSAEYKMWGNGISLPTALYVMQGVSEAFGR